MLTVTLSDASLADAPSKVLAQKAVRTEGKQSPFSFVLPFNPADVQPNARILLSAAITVNDKLVFITDTVQPVINQGGTKADLTLVPVQQTAVPGQASGGATATVPSTSPTQVNPSSAGPAPTQYSAPLTLSARRGLVVPAITLQVDLPASRYHHTFCQ